MLLALLLLGRSEKSSYWLANSLIWPACWYAKAYNSVVINFHDPDDIVSLMYYVPLQSMMASPGRLVSVLLRTDICWFRSIQTPLQAQNTSASRTEVVPASLVCAKFYHYSPLLEAGHNRWSKIGRKKAIVDLKRSNVIQKYRNQIINAIRAGKSSDVDANIRLASVIGRAKDAGISKSSVDGAIAHATTKHESGEVIVYEGRADDGYMILIEVMTDNKNRTRPILKKCLKDHG